MINKSHGHIHSYLNFWSLWQIDNNINGKKQHTAQKVNYIAQHMYINLNIKKKKLPLNTWHQY